MVTINYLREENRASHGDGGDETLTRRGRDPPVGHPSRLPFRGRNLFRSHVREGEREWTVPLIAIRRDVSARERITLTPARSLLESR